MEKNEETPKKKIWWLTCRKPVLDLLEEELQENEEKRPQQENDASPSTTDG